MKNPYAAVFWVGISFVGFMFLLMATGRAQITETIVIRFAAGSRSDGLERVIIYFDENGRKQAVRYYMDGHSEPEPIRYRRRNHFQQ